MNWSTKKEKDEMFSDVKKKNIPALKSAFAVFWKICVVFRIFILFFVLPTWVYRAVYLSVDRYFRIKEVPYPSEYFASATGVGAVFFALSFSFFIEWFLSHKKED